MIVAFLVGALTGLGVGFAVGLSEARPFQKAAMDILTNEIARLNRERDIQIAEKERWMAARARQAVP